jgi:hypothetical protein
MAVKTAVAGDGFGPKHILAIIGVIGAGTTVYKVVKGQPVEPLRLASSLLTLFLFFK